MEGEERGRIQEKGSEVEGERYSRSSRADKNENGEGAGTGGERMADR